MLHILLGEDDFSRRQALEEIKQSIGDPTALMPNTTMLEGSQVTPEQLRAACETVPFLASKRLVVVAGLLARFEPKGRPAKKKSKNQNGQEAAYQTLVDGIKKLPPFTELVLLDGQVNERNPLLRELMSLGKVRTFPMLKANQLAQWLEKGSRGKAASRRKRWPCWCGWSATTSGRCLMKLISWFFLPAAGKLRRRMSGRW